MSFMPMVYVPQDVLVAMGSINKTMMVIQGPRRKNEPPNLPKFLPSSSVFGEDIILKTVTEKAKQRKWSVAAVSYCDVFELTNRKLLIILTSGMYKETYGFIRKHATRMLLRNAMPLALKEAMENPAVHTFHDVAMLLTGSWRRFQPMSRKPSMRITPVCLPANALHQYEVRFHGDYIPKTW